MESASDDDLISSIAPDVTKCLRRCGFFEKLDGLLSPEDNSIPAQACDGTDKPCESILIAAGFDRAELNDIFAVLQSKGGFCDIGAAERLDGFHIHRTLHVPTPIRHGNPILRLGLESLEGLLDDNAPRDDERDKPRQPEQLRNAKHQLLKLLSSDDPTPIENVCVL
jgi:hypothetical protein